MSPTNRNMAAMVTAAGLAVATLMGCSSTATDTPVSNTTDQADSSQKTLSVAFWNYGQLAEDANKVLADGFMESHEDVNIALSPVAGDNWGMYYANLATLIASGEELDLAFTASEGIKFLAQNDLVVPINEYLEGDDAADLRDDIAPSLLESFSVEGEITAIPNGWNNMVIYYNTKVFEEAGVPFPTADWTWEEFRTVAEELTKDTNGDGVNDQYGFTWASNEIFPGVLPWITNADGNLVNDDVTEATANSAPVVEAVTFLNGLIEDGIAPAPSPMGDIFTAFQNGSVAMFGAGRWPTATFLPAGFTDFDIQLYPKGATYRTVAGANGYAIMQSSSDKDLAWEFQKYSVSPEIQDAQIGTPTEPRDAIPSLRSTAEKTVDAGIPPESGALYYDSVDEHPALTPFPAPAKYSEYEATVLRHLQLIFAGEVEVEAGLDAMQEELSAAIAS